jgi:endoglucanase
MTKSRELALDFLSRLGAQAAVAFHESGVATTIKAILGELGLGFRVDDFGNIIVQIRGRLPGSAPMALVAHMDHPGFEAIAVEKGYFVGKALGGVPAASFAGGVRLQVILEDGRRLPATTLGRHGEESERQVLIRLEQPQPLALPRPVVFDVTDFWQDGELIHMRAADDLAGCGSILAALARLAGPDQPPPGDVYGVFTRAEEVGLVGARLLAEAGTLPQGTLVVSVESSRSLPGAEIGQGPVVRVGDAGSTFSAQAEGALMRARETLQAGTPLYPPLLRGDTGGFKAQRQLMSGGVCEASAFALYGYHVTGIALPLGNYHNAGPEGRIEAEFIHVDDFVGAVELMVEAAHRVNEREDTSFSRRLRQLPDEIRSRLRASARGYLQT